MNKDDEPIFEFGLTPDSGAATVLQVLEEIVALHDSPDFDLGPNDGRT